ncbi:MAG: hypothetical protein A2941_03070 [Candidatus Yanofskybacteria bacterium RIFCSPLOWO2_01_FULL_49_17]|uniref:Reverse transcriptase domain-containing protein n=1 Tax=Candidatus Yanofskybacteria bacterium RIFCSPLOWO2_01_FULL_49_17 TaxID=1802700 RepID=A0A1F8GRH8_9BACT|nr:MAG: hypothetical protein A2941_03070 [Candidatus Yanofskybacteria bacterium RIFCSPLOWO2_01_FULL_49_17]
MPIGNLTSQLFGNIYMNEFDQFVKHKLRVKNYCRYTDDFIIVSSEKEYLEELIPRIEAFLGERLHLKLHPAKVSIRKMGQGVDFLGYVQFLNHRLLRVKTRRRIFRKFNNQILKYQQGIISREKLNSSLQSYLGVFGHADTFSIEQELLNLLPI